jgi:hypothetical protein
VGVGATEEDDFVRAAEGDVGDELAAATQVAIVFLAVEGGANAEMRGEQVVGHGRLSQRA